MKKSSNEDEYWNGQKLDLDKPNVIKEDDSLLVINKPPYMSTHPTGRHLFNCATVFYEQQLNQKTVHSIHRLDRETSGALLLAKNPVCANKLTTEFENNNVKKCYFWIAKKIEINNKKTFTAKERMDNPEAGLKKVVVQYYPEDSAKGKHAETKFNILGENELYAYGLAFPKTGRTHQIRVHAMAHGLPLVGDKLYLGGYKMFQRFKDGDASEEDHNQMILTRHALHAIALKITYNKKLNLFIAPLPQDMKDFLSQNFDQSVTEIEQLVAKEIEGAL